MFHVALPDKPVDGFKIEYYMPSQYRVGGAVKCRIEYHVNTPYETFDPEGGRGAQIVNEWMHFEANSCQGRSEGWEAPLKFKWEDCYQTASEARGALLSRLAKEAEGYERRAVQIREVIASL